MFKPVYHFLILFLLISVHSKGAEPKLYPEKARILILTDIENEPDDAMSMMRFLLYSNQFDVEGIVATTSCWQRNKTAEWRVHEIVDAYGKVRDNLEKHEKGYPTQAFLKEKIRKGYPDFGMAAVGEGKDSEGSDLIIEVVDKPDPRPVWIPIWGGANCLAQALWKVKNTRSAEEVKNSSVKSGFTPFPTRTTPAPGFATLFMICFISLVPDMPKTTRTVIIMQPGQVFRVNATTTFRAVPINTLLIMNGWISTFNKTTARLANNIPIFLTLWKAILHRLCTLSIMGWARLNIPTGVLGAGVMNFISLIPAFFSTSLNKEKSGPTPTTG